MDKSGEPSNNLSGQVTIVTGANSGIGKETALGLAKTGATVVLACRDATKTAIVVEELKKLTKNDNIEFMKLDLTDLKSIREFSEEFKKKYSKLNILVNNAGVMSDERKITKDGFELQFGTNHLGPFHLTTLLLDAIKQAAPSRIVNVSSMMSEKATMNWDDLMYEKDYSNFTVYSQSKLANVMFTKELQRQLKDSNVKVVCLHPGFVNTNIMNAMGGKWYLKAALTVFSPLIWLAAKSPSSGAKTTLHCALMNYDELKGGAYYTDSKVKVENPLANNEDNCKRLWDVSEKLINAKLTN